MHILKNYLHIIPKSINNKLPARKLAYRTVWKAPPSASARSLAQRALRGLALDQDGTSSTAEPPIQSTRDWDL